MLHLTCVTVHVSDGSVNRVDLNLVLNFTWHRNRKVCYTTKSYVSGNKRHLLTVKDDCRHSQTRILFPALQCADKCSEEQWKLSAEAKSVEVLYDTLWFELHRYCDVIFSLGMQPWIFNFKGMKILLQCSYLHKTTLVMLCWNNSQKLTDVWKVIYSCLLRFAWYE